MYDIGSSQRLLLHSYSLWYSVFVSISPSRPVIQSLSSTLEDELDSTEVAALCFLCRDVVSRSHLKVVSAACSILLSFHLFYWHVYGCVTCRTDSMIDSLDMFIFTDRLSNAPPPPTPQITNIKDLFSSLKEKGLLQNNCFLSQLLSTIDWVDLVRSLGIDSKRSKDTDGSPVLSQYRWTQSHIDFNMTACI